MPTNRNRNTSRICGLLAHGFTGCQVKTPEEGNWRMSLPGSGV